MEEGHAERMRYGRVAANVDAALDRSTESLTELDRSRGTAGNRVYYLAVPPDAFETIVGGVGKRRSAEGWTRLIVEKPFGHDLASALELNDLVHRYFEENEIYRIDHYQGKA